ncbi:MAG: double zinc ribbon domain-containing protein [Bacteroidales bacterium]
MYINYLTDLIFPRRCVVCGKILLPKEKFICSFCLADMPLTHYWDWPENPAEKILWGRTYAQRVTPLFFYTREANYRHILQEIKYHDNKHLAVFMGMMLGKYLFKANFREKIDILMPIPLHWRKKQIRGYNQAELICRGISKILGSPVNTHIIKRNRFTHTQTQVDVNDKWRNVEGAFSLTARAHNIIQRLRNKKSILYGNDRLNIMLVDDVLTTGATMEACSNELLKESGVNVYVATLAFVAPS